MKQFDFNDAVASGEIVPASSQESPMIIIARLIDLVEMAPPIEVPGLTRALESVLHSAAIPAEELVDWVRRSSERERQLKNRRTWIANHIVWRITFGDQMDGGVDYAEAECLPDALTSTNSHGYPLLSVRRATEEDAEEIVDLEEAGMLEA